MLLWLHYSHRLLSAIDTPGFLLTLNCVSKCWPPWFISGAGHLSGWPAFTSGLWEAADSSISCSGQCRSWSIFHTRTSPESDNWTENSSVYTGNVQVMFLSYWFCQIKYRNHSHTFLRAFPFIVVRFEVGFCTIVVLAVPRWGEHTKACFHQTTDFQLYFFAQSVSVCKLCKLGVAAL